MKIALAVVGGLLLSTSGTGFQIWFFTFLAISIWIWFLHREHSPAILQITFIFWLVAAFFTLEWLSVLGWDARFALSAFVASFWTLWIYPWLRYVRNGCNRFINLTLAICITAGEYVLSIAPFGGFNWLRITYLLSDIPLTGITYWFGVWVLTFITVYFISALVTLDIKNSIKFLQVLILLIFVTATSMAVPDQGSDSVVTYRVVAIQGSVPRSGLDFNAQRQAVFDNHLKQTQITLNQLEQKPNLILWPENAVDVDPFTNKQISEKIVALTSKFDVPLIAGAVVESDQGLLNAAIISQNGQVFLSYIKRKLVPFGEYLPFRNLLAPVISRFDRLSRDFVPSKNSGVVVISDLKIGLLICYEVAFDQLWKLNADQGAQINLVLTNNATYSGTNQPLQQLRITQLQAKALRVPILIASTSGISAYIDSDGKIRDLNSQNEPASLIIDMPIMTSKSPSKVISVPMQQAILLVWSIYVTGLIVMSIRRRKVHG